MPTYSYVCQCGSDRDVFHGIFDKTEVLCSCGSIMGRAITVGAGAYVKAITPVKYWKEDRLRMKKSAALEVRQIERHGSGSKLVPNYNGEELASWDDAKKKAIDDGRSTKHFDKMIGVEKVSNNSAAINEKRWNAAKEKLKHII